MPHLALVLAGLVATTGPTENSDVVWQWDRDTLACALRQQISSSGEKIELRRTPGDETSGVLIIIPSHAKLSKIQNTRGAIKLDPDEETVADVSRWSDPDKGFLFVSAGIEDRAFQEKLSHAQSLEITGEGIEPVKVALKSSGAAVAALDQCEERRMKEWAIDPVYLRTLKTGPKPVKPLHERMSAIDYPHMALAYSVQSDIFIRLDVGADGNVTKCRALNASQYKGFEYAACDAMKGARFKAAIDLDGRAVPAPYIFELQFQMR